VELVKLFYWCAQKKRERKILVYHKIVATWSGENGVNPQNKLLAKWLSLCGCEHRVLLDQKIPKKMFQKIQNFCFWRKRRFFLGQNFCFWSNFVDLFEEKKYLGRFGKKNFFFGIFKIFRHILGNWPALGEKEKNKCHFLAWVQLYNSDNFAQLNMS